MRLGDCSRQLRIRYLDFRMGIARGEETGKKKTQPDRTNNEGPLKGWILSLLEFMQPVSCSNPFMPLAHGMVGFGSERGVIRGLVRPFLQR